MKRTLAAAALAVLAMVGTAGCFADEAGTGRDGADRLRVGLAFGPRRQMSAFTDDAPIAGRLGAVETLVNLDRHGTAVPALAESWSRVDARTTRLTLRRGVIFHDGTPLTAANAANALRRAAAAKPVLKALVAVALTVTTVGDDVLEVRTAAPDAVLLSRLAAPHLMILAPRAYQRDPASPDPVGAGTGPYRLVAVGAAGATLQRHDRYWGGRPALAGLDVRFLPDGAARAGALRSGAMHVINQTPVAQLPHLGDRRLIEIPLPRTVSLYLINAAGRPFADPGLRAAARAAIDARQLAGSVYEGRADPGAGLFGPASEWAATGRAAWAGARAAQAPASGRKIRLFTYPERPELPEVASALAAALTDRGFAVDTLVQGMSTSEPDLLAGRFDAVILSRSYVLDTGDPIAFLSSDFSCAGSYNLSKFCDPAFDAEIAKAAALTDTSARRAAALALEADLVDRAVVVPLVHERAWLGAAKNVTGLVEDPYERALITARTALR